MGGNRETLQRYALAVPSHLLLVAAWHFFVVLGQVPKFVMPSPYDTVHALLVPNYRWTENILVTTSDDLGGYILAVVVGVGIALLFSWFRTLEMLAMPLLVSLNMIPKVALGPLIIVWFSYGIGPNMMMVFAICFFPIVLTTARGLREVEPDLLDLVRTLKGSRWDFNEIELPGALPYIFSGMKVAAILAVAGAIVGEFLGSGSRSRLSDAAGPGHARHRRHVHGSDPHHADWHGALWLGARSSSAWSSYATPAFNRVRMTDPVHSSRRCEEGLSQHAARTFLAVSQATFDVEAGELAALVGPSGLRQDHAPQDFLAGLHTHEAGEVRIGSATQPFNPSRDIGMVFQQPLLLKMASGDRQRAVAGRNPRPSD